MFPLWDVAIAPVLTGARARKVVEIGALRGENTVQILDHLGPRGELHVIDPVPDFDPAEHEAQFPGRYFFHRALSLDVLPTLEPMDAALIDGDHNWWTVYNECSMLAASATRAGVPMPVMILHDVGWPYGRRDLYYDPSNVPEEHRQPYDFLGMRPGQRKLAKRGGLNPTMANALEEGGEHNGVMTGVDDFVKEYPKPIRQVLLPFYFGLAFLVEEERLEAEPELAAAFDRLAGADARFEMLQVAEDIRIKAMLFQHNVFFQRETEAARGARRYLDVVKKALLNLHYPETEARLEILTTSDNPDPLALRDPAHYGKNHLTRVLRQRTGQAGPDAAGAASFLPFTAMGKPRIDHLESCLEIVRTEGVPGDLVECGTGRGGGAVFLRAFLEAHEIVDREVWVADRFRSAPDPDDAPQMPARGIAGFQADLNMVRDGFERFDLLDERVHFVQGPYSSTLPAAGIEQIALLRIGKPVGASVRAVLECLYDSVADGGVVIIDELSDESTRAEVEAFRTERGVTAPLERFDEATVAWRRSADDGAAAAVPAPVIAGPRMIGAAPTESVDLTVVVVFYNMRREAERTLRSLSRGYQEEISELTYEVVAIDNGSDPDQRLDADFVQSFGPEFRFIDMADDARPSPVPALNRGIATGKGKTFALMIDGAHVLTPGVLRYAMMAMRDHAPAIVATQQWYVGPGQQGEAMDDGYDQVYEDQLFAKIKWPHAGYRLFEIGHFVGDRDWFDGVWESNCMFVSRTQLEQVGGFDESFDEPGGGYANLELYERLGNAPDVTVCSMIGEGSFHQVHGGTTTNQTDSTARRHRIFGYSRHYAELRGRGFKGPGKPLHFVGRLPNEAARRSKPRRLNAKAFTDIAGFDDDGMPTSPMPLPEDLASAFTEAIWRTLPWRGTNWLGQAIGSAPTDLLAYQEIIATVLPDFVIETGAGGGGRSLFLATMCELVGHGRVLAIGPDNEAELPVHDRLTFHAGSAGETSTMNEIESIVGDSRALVVLGSRLDRASIYREFKSLSPMVPVGSYVVVTDTILNGHPVWPAFGPGPAEAVKQILTSHGEFVPDSAMEKYGLTFNPGGFLLRGS
jgi:cephalosporin hydroxylase